MKTQYWCWWKSRYLFLVDMVEDRYVMEDIAGEVFDFTPEQFAKLERR